MGHEDPMVTLAPDTSNALVVADNTRARAMEALQINCFML